MHFRATPFDIYMDSYDHSIDAIVAIGMHAGAGNRTGFLAHAAPTPRLPSAGDPMPKTSAGR
jgi:hypothetical protein